VWLRFWKDAKLLLGDAPQDKDTATSSSSTTCRPHYCLMKKNWNGKNGMEKESFGITVSQEV
jgi:hypothetical protein